MPHSAKTKPPKSAEHHKEGKRPERLSDDQLLDLVQRQTFLFFWDGAQPASGLARDRTGRLADPDDDIVAIGGSGFGVMALIVACERGWVTRPQALARLSTMLDCLERATCYHGLYPHFMHGQTGATKPFSRKDDGADLVESAFLFQGLLCARAYFDRDTPEEAANSWRRHLSLERGGMGLVHPGRPRRAHLALESDQRLCAEPPRPGLERVPYRLRAGGLGPPLCDGGRSLS